MPFMDGPYEHFESEVLEIPYYIFARYGQKQN